MKKMLSLIVLMNCTLAFANTSIECGKNVNFEDGTLERTVFMLSSENGDPFIAYNAVGKKITNAKLINGEKGILILTVARAQGLGGSIGDKFVIANPNGGNFTKAERFAVGGFAGGSKVDTLDCVVSEM